jgi:hypothetical protein
MPRPDPIPSPSISVLQKFRRIMKWMALLSVVVAAIAVLLVIRGDKGAHIHMMIATALVAGLCVLLAGGLMSLVFLSAGGRHDKNANRFEEDEDN